LIPHNSLNVAVSAHCAATPLDGTGRANPHGTIALASSDSFAQKGRQITACSSDRITGTARYLRISQKRY
jgi:hypothetical protein